MIGQCRLVKSIQRYPKRGMLARRPLKGFWVSDGIFR